MAINDFLTGFVGGRALSNQVTAFGNDFESASTKEQRLSSALASRASARVNNLNSDIVERGIKVATDADTFLDIDARVKSLKNKPGDQIEVIFREMENNPAFASDMQQELDLVAGPTGLGAAGPRRYEPADIAKAYSRYREQLFNGTAAGQAGRILSESANERLKVEGLRAGVVGEKVDASNINADNVGGARADLRTLSIGVNPYVARAGANASIQTNEKKPTAPGESNVGNSAASDPAANSGAPAPGQYDGLTTEQLQTELGKAGEELADIKKEIKTYTGEGRVGLGATAIPLNLPKEAKTYLEGMEKLQAEAQAKIDSMKIALEPRIKALNPEAVFDPRTRTLQTPPGEEFVPNTGGQTLGGEAPSKDAAPSAMSEEQYKEFTASLSNPNDSLPMVEVLKNMNENVAAGIANDAKSSDIAKATGTLILAVDKKWPVSKLSDILIGQIEEYKQIKEGGKMDREAMMVFSATLAASPPKIQDALIKDLQDKGADDTFLNTVTDNIARVDAYNAQQLDNDQVIIRGLNTQATNRSNALKTEQDKIDKQKAAAGAEQASYEDRTAVNFNRILKEVWDKDNGPMPAGLAAAGPSVARTMSKINRLRYAEAQALAEKNNRTFGFNTEAEYAAAMSQTRNGTDALMAGWAKELTDNYSSYRSTPGIFELYAVDQLWGKGMLGKKGLKEEILKGNNGKPLSVKELSVAIPAFYGAWDAAGMGNIEDAKTNVVASFFHSTRKKLAD